MPRPKRGRRSVVLVLTLLVLGSGSVPAAGEGQFPAVEHRLGITERMACHAALEEVYWRHRQWPGQSHEPGLSFSQTVPSALIRAKAEDSVRKSLALERHWGVTITGPMLQAELDRMAAATM